MFSVKNITMIYDIEKENKMYALGGFDLELPDKGLVGFIGPSGSGKSTLMYCLSTLKRPTGGEILYNGKDIINLKDYEREDLRRKEFGFVFQRHFLVPYMSALDNVIIAADKSNKQTEERAGDILRKLGLGERELKKRPSKLSGGQRQRIAIARSLYFDPDILILDEATSALDTETEISVMDAIETLHGRKTLIIVAHRLSTIRKCDRIFEVIDGQIVLKDRNEVLCE